MTDLDTYNPLGAPNNDIGHLRSAITAAVSTDQKRLRIGPGHWIFNGIVRDIAGADQVALDLHPQAIVGGSNDLKLTQGLSVGAELYHPTFDKQTCIYDSNDWHYAHQPHVNLGIDDRLPASQDEATNPNITVSFNSSPTSEDESSSESRFIWVAYSTDYGETFTYPISPFNDATYATNPAPPSRDMGNSMIFRHPDNKEWISWNHNLGSFHGGPIVAEKTQLGGKFTHFRFCQDTTAREHIYETTISGTSDTQITDANRDNLWELQGATWSAQIQDWYTALDGTIFAWLTLTELTITADPASAEPSGRERLMSMWREPGDPAGRWQYGPFIPMGVFANMDLQLNEWFAFEMEDGGWMAVIRNTRNIGEGPDYRGDRHGVSFSSDGKHWSAIQYLGTENHDERTQGQRWSEQHQLLFLPDHPGRRRNQSMQIRRSGGSWTSSGFTISMEGDKPEDDEWRQVIDTNSQTNWQDLTSVDWVANANCSIATDTATTPSVPTHINTEHGVTATQAYLWTATNGLSGTKRLQFDMKDALESDLRADVYLRFHCLIKDSGAGGNIKGIALHIASNAANDTVRAEFFLDGTVNLPAGSGTDFGDTKYAYAFERDDDWIKCVGIIKPSTLSSTLVEDVKLYLVHDNGSLGFTAGANDSLLITDVDLTWGRRASVMSSKVIPEQGAILVVHSEGPETFPRDTANGTASHDSGSNRNIHFKRITTGPAANKLNVIPSNRARELFHDPQNTWSHDSQTDILTTKGLTHAALDIGGGRTMTSIPVKLNTAPTAALPIAAIGNQRDYIVASACTHSAPHNNSYLLLERVSEGGGQGKTGGRSVIARLEMDDFTEWTTLVFVADTIKNEVIVEGLSVPLAPPYAIWLGDPFYTTANDAYSEVSSFSATYTREYDLKNISYGAVGYQAGAYVRPDDAKFAPNLLLNAGFNQDSVNQGSAYSVSSNDTNTLDGWALVDRGNTTVTVQQTALSDAEAREVQDGWPHTAKLAAGSASTNGEILFGQDFDGVRAFNGKLLMLSFDFWDLNLSDNAADAEDLVRYPLYLQWRRNYGTGGSPTSETTEIVSYRNVSRTPRRYTVWLQIPEMPDSYTLGSNGDDFCMLLWTLPEDVAFDVRIGRVDLYEGLSQRIWTEPDPYLERARLNQLVRVYEGTGDSNMFLQGYMEQATKFSACMDFLGMVRPPSLVGQGKFKLDQGSTQKTGLVVGSLDTEIAMQSFSQTSGSSEVRIVDTVTSFTALGGASLFADDTATTPSRLILDARRTSYSA